MDRRKFLTTAGLSLAVSTLEGIPQATADAATREASKTSSERPHRPNIVFIICDDLGYGDLGCYGSKIATPNIDRLAVNGVRFTNHCTPIPICSASRAAVMTGLYPTRVGVLGAYAPQDPGGMSLNVPTVANVMQKSGYKTMAVGKWHLGDLKEYLPTSRGFDEYYGVPYSVDMNPLPLLHNTRILEREANRDILTQQYTQQAVKFIQRSKHEPFFLYMAHSYPHIPLHASAGFRGKSQLGLYGDVVHEIDWSVGEVIKAIKQNGIQENTLVFFTSDHGPWFQGSTGNLRGRKGMTYEGGVRIPMIASMPGTLPQDKTTDALASHMDMLPTFAKLGGAVLPPEPLDGSDIWGLLSCEQEAVERKALLSFSGWNIQCARWKQWKLHISRKNGPPWTPSLREGIRNYWLRNPELYNLAEDPKESYDIAPQHPEIVASIQKSIEEQLATLPDQVKKAYSQTQQNLSNPLMPADSYPEFMNAGVPCRGWLVGDEAERILQRFD